MIRADRVVDRLLKGTGGRWPRADARRNVERLVTATQIAIADVGIDVTAHEIARRAGVGIGTFYRRVPSREALLEAVLSEILDELVTLADDALSDDVPWNGFCAFAAAYVQLRAASCGLNEALRGGCGLDLDPHFAILREKILQLVEHTQATGSLRADVAWQDVPFLLASVTTGDRTLGLRADEHQWRRNLQIVLDGLRATQPGPTDIVLPPRDAPPKTTPSSAAAAPTPTTSTSAPPPRTEPNGSTATATPPARSPTSAARPRRTNPRHRT